MGYLGGSAGGIGTHLEINIYYKKAKVFLKNTDKLGGSSVLFFVTGVYMLKVVTTFIISLLFFSCKPRLENETKDFDTLPDANEFVLQVQGQIDTSFNSQATCASPNYQKRFNYLNPFDGQTIHQAAVSRCMKFKLTRTKLGKEKNIPFDSATVSYYQLETLAEQFFCPHEYKSYEENRQTRDHFQYYRRYRSCARNNSKMIEATMGYFIQLAANESIPGLEKFHQVKQVKPRLLSKKEISGLSVDEFELAFNTKYGQSGAPFQVAVPALVSGLASHAFYGDKIFYQSTEEIANKKLKVKEVLMRQLAVSQNLVSYKHNAKSILAMPETCHRKLEDACLSFKCTSVELRHNKLNFSSEYQTCKMDLFESLRVFSSIILLPITLSANLFTPFSDNELDVEALENLNDLQFHILSDKKKRIYVEEEWDVDELDRYFRLLGI